MAAYKSREKAIPLFSYEPSMMLLPLTNDIYRQQTPEVEGGTGYRAFRTVRRTPESALHYTPKSFQEFILRTATKVNSRMGTAVERLLGYEEDGELWAHDRQTLLPLYNAAGTASLESISTSRYYTGLESPRIRTGHYRPRSPTATSAQVPIGIPKQEHSTVVRVWCWIKEFLAVAWEYAVKLVRHGVGNTDRPCGAYLESSPHAV
jgi:hypothetical protein